MLEDELTLEIDGLNLDAVWDNFIIQVGGVELEQGNSLDEQIAVDERKEKLIKEIEKLEKQARNEKQPNKKFELVQKMKELQLSLIHIYAVVVIKLCHDGQQLIGYADIFQLIRRCNADKPMVIAGGFKYRAFVELDCPFQHIDLISERNHLLSLFPKVVKLLKVGFDIEGGIHLIAVRCVFNQIVFGD